LGGSTSGSGNGAAAARIVRARDLTPLTPPTRRVFVPLASDPESPVQMGFVVMEPGGLMTPCHYHNHMTEVYFVLRGSGIITLDNEDHALGEHDTVRIPPGVRHIWRNPHEEPLEYLWILSPRIPGDTIAVDTPTHIH
jgi:mannose-6-phosphate isomerase-like protein (cupin superfamily)